MKVICESYELCTDNAKSNCGHGWSHDEEGYNCDEGYCSVVNKYVCCKNDRTIKLKKIEEKII